jgi:hypothetical protein
VIPSTIVVLAAICGVARADGKPQPAPARIDCFVHNNTDHGVRLYHYTLAVGKSGIVMGQYTLEDRDQRLELACDTRDTHLKLVGTAGAVTVERLPSWFVAYGDDGAVRVTARKPGAAVEVDGTRVNLSRGEAVQPIDVRAKLLSGDPAVLSSGDNSWRALLEVKASAGDERASIVVAVDLMKAMRELLGELGHAGTAPVAWASPPDRAGPAIVFGCTDVRRRGPVVAPSDYELARSPRSLSALTLVASCRTAPVVVETCPLSKDPYFKSSDRAERVRVDGQVTLVEAKTGKVVATKTLTGDEPAPCRDTAIGGIYGDPPSKRAIAHWLDSVR